MNLPQKDKCQIVAWYAGAHRSIALAWPVTAQVIGLLSS